jgi:hypothetical protein
MADNQLRTWFDQTKTPREAFLEKTGISQSYLTLLLGPTPPWPSRIVLRRLIEATDGFVTADGWLALDDPPPQRIERD